jgi:hypothetical protein
MFLSVNDTPRILWGDGQVADKVDMAPAPRVSTQRAEGRARTGAIGTIVAAFAFFDGVFVGAPIALLAASLRPLPVFVAATVAVACLAVACSAWLDRRWDDWLSGNDKRVANRLETMRASRLMRRPVAWIEGGSDRQYAFASALANPVLVVAVARSVSGKPIGGRRIRLGSIAYAIPYVAMWTLFGAGLSDAIHAI